MLCRRNVVSRSAAINSWKVGRRPWNRAMEKMSLSGCCRGMLSAVTTSGPRPLLALQPRVVGITLASLEGHEDWEIKLPVQTA